MDEAERNQAEKDKEALTIGHHLLAFHEAMEAVEKVREKKRQDIHETVILTTNAEKASKVVQAKHLELTNLEKGHKHALAALAAQKEKVKALDAEQHQLKEGAIRPNANKQEKSRLGSFRQA